VALPRYCSNCAAPLPGPPPVTCPACDTSHWLDAKPCAGALVTREGRLMLVRRAHEPWKGSWDVPGGFCGAREHPADAAMREVREETGLPVRVTGLLGMWIDTYAPDGPNADKVTLNIYFHDVRFLVGVALTLWFYVTPVIYPVSYVPDKYRIVFDLNPNSLFINAYRRVLLDGLNPGLDRVLAGLAIAALTFLIGYFLFKRMESDFADRI